MTYVLISDGECNEGSVWEAALFAPAKKLNNLCVVVDYNKWQATGRSRDVLNLHPLKEKFKFFGWNVLEINGHAHKAILKALMNAKKQTIKTLINTYAGRPRAKYPRTFDV